MFMPLNSSQRKQFSTKSYHSSPPPPNQCVSPTQSACPWLGRELPHQGTGTLSAAPEPSALAAKPNLGTLRWVYRPASSLTPRPRTSLETLFSLPDITLPYSRV